MKLNARGRFIGIMGHFWFHLDFKSGCNLCHKIIRQFTLKDTKPITYSATVNGLSCDTMSFLSHGPVQRSGLSAVI